MRLRRCHAAFGRRLLSGGLPESGFLLEVGETGNCAADSDAMVGMRGSAVGDTGCDFGWWWFWSELLTSLVILFLMVLVLLVVTA